MMSKPQVAHIGGVNLAQLGFSKSHVDELGHRLIAMLARMVGLVAQRRRYGTCS